MTDTGPSDDGRRRWPRWKGILLVVSLAVNLLIAGLVATAAIRHRFAPPPGLGQATVVAFARTLPEPRRQEIWQAARGERSALRPFRRELRLARDEVRKALLAEPFDAERFKNAHHSLLVAEDSARKAAHALYEAVALRMTAEERRSFVQWQAMAERPWRRHRFKGGSGGSADADDDAGGASESSKTKN